MVCAVCNKNLEKHSLEELQICELHRKLKKGVD